MIVEEELGADEVDGIGLEPLQILLAGDERGPTLLEAGGEASRVIGEGPQRRVVSREGLDRCLERRVLALRFGGASCGLGLELGQPGAPVREGTLRARVVAVGRGQQRRVLGLGIGEVGVKSFQLRLEVGELGFSLGLLGRRELGCHLFGRCEFGRRCHDGGVVVRDVCAQLGDHLFQRRDRLVGEDGRVARRCCGGFGREEVRVQLGARPSALAETVPGVQERGVEGCEHRGSLLDRDVERCDGVGNGAVLFDEAGTRRLQVHAIVDGAGEPLVVALDGLRERGVLRLDLGELPIHRRQLGSYVGKLGFEALGGFTLGGFTLGPLGGRLLRALGGLPARDDRRVVVHDCRSQIGDRAFERRHPRHGCGCVGMRCCVRCLDSVKARVQLGALLGAGGETALAGGDRDVRVRE